MRHSPGRQWTHSIGSFAGTLSQAHLGSTDHSPDHVRRRRHAAVAGVARKPAQAVPAAVRSAFDVSGNHPPRLRSGSVWPADHRHQQPISVSGRRAARRDRRAADILLEPMRRDSGPAIVAGAAFARKRGGDPVLVALAADHVVTDPAGFAKVCALAADAAADRIVTFGVRPTRPATEYGYIRAGAAIGPDIFAIEKFVEKPDAKTAERYVDEGYLWNSGNFMFRAGLLLDEYKSFRAGQRRCGRGCGRKRRDRSQFCHARHPGICARRGEIDRLRGDGAHQARGGDAGFLRLVGCRFLAGGLGAFRARRARQCRARLGRVCRCTRLLCDDRQAARRAVRRGERGRGHDRRCRAGGQARGRRRPAAAGGETQGSGAGGDRRSSEGASALGLLSVDRSGRRASRSSASWSSRAAGCRCSCIITAPSTGSWCAAPRGSRSATRSRSVHENESIYIPIGAQHRLENPGKIDLELIEVQTGSYLGEDDIVRIEDDYRRS